MNISVRGEAGEKLSIPYFPIDRVAITERANSFTTRSIKSDSKLDALYLALSMIDLTTLEGMDTPGKVMQMCGKAMKPVPCEIEMQMKKYEKFRAIPSTAAVCVYPSMVATAKAAVAGSSVRVASVATAFPAGQLPTEIKISDVKAAVKAGADEIDMVIDRGAFHCGKYQKVFDEIQKVKEACGEEVKLKVILETGELQTFDKVRLASWLAMEAGADFIKTSTGKINPAATMPVTLVMLQAISDYYDEYGIKIGMKPAGGIRTAKQAVHYLCMVNETLGTEWLTPDLFRFGASSLANDVLKQIFKQTTGKYYYEDIFSLD